MLTVTERGWAQAPAWEFAGSASIPQGSTGTAAAASLAVDANGNVLVTGSFTGTVAFGTTRLVSAGGYDVFVAKWNITANTWAWAARSGGTGDDSGGAVAVSGNNVYLTGTFQSGTGAVIAGTALTGAGDLDAFVAKYTDTGTGFTAAWAVSAGGYARDLGYRIAANGNSVYVAGSVDASAGATIAGVPFNNSNGLDMFVAKYTDLGASVRNGWATSGGGPGLDEAYALAVSGTSVYVAGHFTYSAGVFAGTTLANVGNWDGFLAKYTDLGSTFANGWATSVGGTGVDRPHDLAISGNNVYLMGNFASGTGTIAAGTTLTGQGDYDVFLAKYTDRGTSFVNGGAISAGGTGLDVGWALAVSGSSLYLAGEVASGSGAVFAGTSLPGAGNGDVFLAKYTDTGSGFVSNWATSGGGTGLDAGRSIAVSGQRVYTVGYVNPPAAFGNFAINATASGNIGFLARLTDPTLPLAAHPEAPASASLTLVPNPAHAGPATLRGSTPGMAIQVLDALGRIVATATADGTGTAVLPQVLVSGVYVVRSGTSATRLVVE